MNSIKNYEIIQKLGQGTFGVVQKARNLKTKQLVALKQLINHSAKEGFPITAMREITILKSLHHKNILKITDMIYEHPKISNPQDLVHSRGCFYTVSPYMCSDLVGLLENPNITLDLPQIKCFMMQLLQGIEFIHENHFLHRDIKAANILIDFNGTLKIADFGLARNYHGKAPKLGEGPGGGERNYTALVVTRWYRPPELLLGERKYTTAVDLWGVGCVFGELFLHRPILAGQSDSQQIQIIFDLIGPPNQINWAKASELPNKKDFSIGLRCRRTLELRFSKFMSNDGLDLMSGLLTLDPYKRLNAADALDHPYFKNDPKPLLPHELPSYEECHEIDKERFKKLRAAAASNPAAASIIKPIAPSNSKPPVNSLPQIPSHAIKRNNNIPRTDTYIPGKKEPMSRDDINKPSTYIPKSNPPSRDRQESRVHDIRGNSQPLKRTYLEYNDGDKSNNNHEAMKRTASSQQTESPAPAVIQAAKASGIFMTQSRLKAKPGIPRKPHALTKRRKLLDDTNDSDLTDFDEDVKGESASKLNTFLDWDKYSTTNDFQDLETAKKQYGNDVN